MGLIVPQDLVLGAVTLENNVASQPLQSYTLSHQKKKKCSIVLHLYIYSVLYMYSSSICVLTQHAVRIEYRTSFLS